MSNIAVDGYVTVRGQKCPASRYNDGEVWYIPTGRANRHKAPKRVAATFVAARESK